jgi:hypothetical protein
MSLATFATLINVCLIVRALCVGGERGNFFENYASWIVSIQVNDTFARPQHPTAYYVAWFLIYTAVIEALGVCGWLIIRHADRKTESHPRGNAPS